MKSNKFGTWFRQKRIEAELSQNDVAKLLGHSSGQHVSNIERGVSNMHPKSFAKMMRKIGKKISKGSGSVEKEYSIGIKFILDDLHDSAGSVFFGMKK